MLSLSLLSVPIPSQYLGPSFTRFQSPVWFEVPIIAVSFPTPLGGLAVEVLICLADGGWGLLSLQQVVLATWHLYPVL